MSEGINGIDHVVIGVADLDAAAAAFRRLGFALTPRGRHPRFGTANHCAMFDTQNYLELMTVAEPEAEDDLFRACLMGHAGPVAVAWRTDDAQAVGRDWAAAGLAPREPVDFARPVETEAGRRDARFSIVALAPGRLPGLMGFAIRHETPELVWRPGSTEHPNGAIGIAGLVGVADAPARLAEPFACALGYERVMMDSDGLLVETGTAPMRFVTPARFDEVCGIAPDPRLATPALAGIAVFVDSANWVRQLLDANAVSFLETERGVVVPPEHGCGAVVEFAEG